MENHCFELDREPKGPGLFGFGNQKDPVPLAPERKVKC